ncbi:MAG TPA: SPFH domain-containing protein [Thermodesulfobacteriota bacterium]|nr:SPFH domain-containing protein [Thermodesulfobacteriota bacterium]
MKLDEVFEKKDDIAIAVNSDLRIFMDEFGHSIVKALVMDIEPDAKVKDAMNEINAAERLRIAAQEKGEAEKILKVKQAEADMESKRLEGEGISGQRKAIVKGFKEAVEDTAKALNINTDEVCT